MREDVENTSPWHCYSTPLSHVRNSSGNFKKKKKAKQPLRSLWNSHSYHCRICPTTALNMKRKTDDTNHSNGIQIAKKRILTEDTVLSRFRDGLFEPAELEKYTKSYANSTPYVRFIITVPGYVC